MYMSVQDTKVSAAAGKILEILDRHFFCRYVQLDVSYVSRFIPTRRDQQFSTRAQEICLWQCLVGYIACLQTSTAAKTKAI